MTPAETITARRKAAGLTQAALAEALGVAYQHVQRWERGRRTPSAQSAEALRKALGGALGDYLDLGGNRK